MKNHYIRLFVISALFIVFLSSTVFGSENNEFFPELTQSENIPALSIESIISSDDADLGEKVEENEEDKKSVGDVVPEISDSDICDEVYSSGCVTSGGVDNDNTIFYSALSDSVDEIDFQSISENVISINEVLHEIKKAQKDFNTKFSRSRESQALFQEDLLYLLLSISSRLSANEIKSVSLDSVEITLSYDQIEKNVSENMIEISENSVDPSEPEVVSFNDVSTNSISKNDINQLHQDNEDIKDLLKQVFFVGIFGVLALFLLVAGQLEQIIFRRMRG